jgi:hypothetical protein
MKLSLLPFLCMGVVSGIKIEKANLRRASEPNVVTKGTCEELLEKMAGASTDDDENENTDADCGADCPCNEPRTNMLSQCAGQVEDFYIKVGKHCPNLAPERSNEFHPTPYVEKLPDSASPSDTPIKKNTPASSPDGKPVDAWGEYPGAPNPASEEKMVAAQKDDCKGDGCKGVLAPPDGMTVSSNAIGAASPAEADAETAVAKTMDPIADA